MGGDAKGPTNKRKQQELHEIRKIRTGKTRGRKTERASMQVVRSCTTTRIRARKRTAVFLRALCTRHVSQRKARVIGGDLIPVFIKNLGHITQEPLERNSHETSNQTWLPVGGRDNEAGSETPATGYARRTSRSGRKGLLMAGEGRTWGEIAIYLTLVGNGRSVEKLRTSVHRLLRSRHSRSKNRRIARPNRDSKHTSASDATRSKGPGGKLA